MDDFWKDDAACGRVEDPDIFFPVNYRQFIEAKKICEGCPVKRMCRSYADGNRERFGVWGGESRTNLRLDQVELF